MSNDFFQPLSPDQERLMREALDIEVETQSVKYAIVSKINGKTTTLLTASTHEEALQKMETFKKLIRLIVNAQTAAKEFTNATQKAQ